VAASSSDWCESGWGTSNVLVVAPHGGTSREDLLSADAAGRRGNDLHTASLARELARRHAGALLVNAVHDRNALDLNRVRDVVNRAPWFLIELERHLERILGRHGSAVVLFVHGWHVGQARCDLGIGASLSRAADAAAADALTASPEFVAHQLEPFRRDLEAAGVIATYGERWPAAHRNNVMRLFRRRMDPSAPVARLARWGAAGRIDAVQLELGVPLRWPGRLRERFVAATRRAFGRGGNGPSGGGNGPNGGAPPTPLVVSARGRGDPPSSLALQAFDPTCGPYGLGIVMGAMRLRRKDVGARLQLFPGGQRMGIFTGHGEIGPVLGVPDLYFEALAGGFIARFRGQVLEVEDAADYFRWESHQAAASLCDASVEVVFRERAGGVGDLSGHVSLAGERFEVRTTAFADGRLHRPRTSRHGTRILASFVDSPPLRLEGDATGTRWVLARLGAHGWEETEQRGAWVEHGEDRFTVDLGGRGALRGEVRTHTALLRPVGPREYVHATFGRIDVQWADQARGAGFYERGRPL